MEPLIMSLDTLAEVWTRHPGCGDDAMMSVDVTPDGRGDCVRTVATGSGVGETRRIFVKPEGRWMTMVEFRKNLRRGRAEWKRKRRRDRHRRGTELSGGGGGGRGEDDGSELDGNGLAVFPLSGAGGSGAVVAPKVLPSPPVLYYSRQDDCLRTDLKPLFDLGLFPSGFTWAERAFGTGPPRCCQPLDWGPKSRLGHAQGSL